MTTDNHKKTTITYNYLNLPAVINFTDGTNRKIEWVYDADGAKLSKTTSIGVTVNSTKDYVGGIEYNGTNLEAIYFAEGRITPNGAAFFYEYIIKDHLGNTRITFRANGASLTTLQENHYYPFGLEMEGSWQAQVGTENAYQYNGKELNEDFGLNWYDYGARWYDAAVGRWWSVDPLGEKSANFTTYAYVFNNPMLFIDPTGMESESYKTKKSESDADRELSNENKWAEINSYINTGLKKDQKSGGCWYNDSDGSIQYSQDGNLNSDQTYLGESYKGTGQSGKPIYYNQGGSIFFKNETDAYNYMWENTEKTTKEHMGVIFKDGVAVLPSYGNDANTSKIEAYGFRFENRNGKIYLSSINYTHKNSVLGTVHTHNADKSGSQGVSGYDIELFGRFTPGRPGIIFENNPTGIGGFLDGVIAYSKNDWAPIDRKTFPSLNQVLSGSAKLSSYISQIK